MIVLLVGCKQPVSHVLASVSVWYRCIQLQSCLSHAAAAAVCGHSEANFTVMVDIREREGNHSCTGACICVV